MRGITFGIGVCGMLAVITASAALAEGSPFVGQWRWDRALSQLPPGDPAPAEMFAEFSRVDQLHVAWSVTVVNAHGHKSIESFDTPANGEFYPINRETTAAFRLSGSTLEATFKGPAGGIDKMTCTVAADQRRLTCEGRVTDSNGRSSPYVDVYDRR